MKLYRNGGVKKVKLPRLNYKNIMLSTGIILSIFGSNFVNIMKNKELDIPKGILFYGNSNNKYTEYVNSNNESEWVANKNKIDINDFELNGHIKVCLCDLEGYYQVKDDPNYKIDDTLSFLEHLDKQKDISIFLEYDLEITNKQVNSVNLIPNTRYIIKSDDGTSSIIKTDDNGIAILKNLEVNTLYSISNYSINDDCLEIFQLLYLKLKFLLKK